MYLRLYILIISALISVGIRESLAEDAKTSGGSSKKSGSEFMYIDDDGDLEGSGNREVKDDLESSGSGYGPDDEDGEGSTDVRQPNKGQVVPLGGVVPTRPNIIEDNVPYKKTSDLDNSDINNNNIGGVKDNSRSAPLPEEPEDNRHDNDVYIMNAKPEERATSFFAQPGILAAVIGGAVVGLLCAILVVMFIVYRMRKKDEGSYALDEPKRSPTSNSYSKNSNREFYA